MTTTSFEFPWRIISTQFWSSEINYRNFLTQETHAACRNITFCLSLHLFISDFDLSMFYCVLSYVIIISWNSTHINHILVLQSYLNFCHYHKQLVKWAKPVAEHLWDLLQFYCHENFMNCFLITKRKKKRWNTKSNDS